jgi:CO/xanthine dehydrogenase FAD-binding subunit
MRDVFLPRSLAELWDHLRTDPRATVYAGGTDLLVQMRRGLVDPPDLICLERIEELKGVSEDNDTIRIGSCVTHAKLLNHPVIRKHLPVLTKAVGGLGSPPIRNMGTIGGNICTASPAGDTLPPLYVLEAEVELLTRSRKRRMPVRDFIVGPGNTCLEEGEVLSAVWIRKPREYNLHHYEKVGQRNALACAIAGFASLLRVSADGVVEKAALAWGSVAPTVLTCPEAEEALVGERLTLKNLKEAAAIVRDAVRPISDVRADADYRRTVSGNLLLRLMDLPARA